jgi:hypothetical protein
MQSYALPDIGHGCRPLTTRLGALLGFVLAVAACARPTPEERRTVDRWLLCEECVDGELDSVVALGDRAVRILEAALRGPSADRRDNMRQQVEAMYRGMRDTVISFQRYADHFASNYVASYQSRAAIALGAIGTPHARKILDGALRRDARYRADVRRALGRSVRATLSLVAGDSQHAPLDSFVKVNPTVMLRDSATGAGLKGVRVRFWVDSGGGTVSDSVRRTDKAGRAAVRWRLGPDSSRSNNILRAVAAGRAVRVHAFGHTPKLRVVFLDQPSSGTVDQPIAPSVRFAVQDAWGITQTNVNQTAVVTVEGTKLGSMSRIVRGVAQVPELRIPEPDTGLVLMVRVPGAAPALSKPFDISP